MEEKQYVSRVKLPDNDTIYYLKDLDARALLEKLFSNEIIINCGTAADHIDPSE